MPPRDIVNIQKSQDQLSTQLLTMRSEITKAFVEAKTAVESARQAAEKVHEQSDRVDEKIDRVDAYTQRLFWAVVVLIVLNLGILGVLL